MKISQDFFFPFGQNLSKVCQVDTTPKNIFVLGLYANAVHARWTDKNGNQKVAALTIASEPSILWTGDNAAEIIISAIKIFDKLKESYPEPRNTFLLYNDK